MLTAALLLLGVALLALTLADSTVKRLPLSPAVIYLLLGWFGRWLRAGQPDAAERSPEPVAGTRSAGPHDTPAPRSANASKRAEMMFISSGTAEKYQ